MAAICLLLLMPFCSASAAAQSADEQYAVAAGHYAARQWDLAAEEFRTFLVRFPEHANANQARFYLGETLVQLRKYSEASEQFSAYLERQPEGTWARQAQFRLGECAYLGNRLDQAESALGAFLRQFAGDAMNAYVLAYLGNIHLRRERLLEAETLFRRAMEEYPNGPKADECRLGLARTLEKQHRAEEAQRFYLALASKNTPLADEAQYCLGALQYRRGDFHQAEATLAVVEQRWPGSAWVAPAQLGRAWALVKLGRLPDAERTLRQIADDQQVGPEAKYWLGLVNKQMGRLQQASLLLLHAAQQYQQHRLCPAMYFHAADALLRAGNYEKAAELFDRAIAWGQGKHDWLEPASAAKVQTEYLRGRHREAIQCGQQFLDQFSGSGWTSAVRCTVARSLLETGGAAEAAALLEPVAGSARPGEHLAERFLLGVICDRLGRHDDAVSQLRAVVEQAEPPLRDRALAVASAVMIRTGRFAEAGELIEQNLAALSEGRSVQIALGNLTICHAFCGRWNQAQQTWNEFLRHNPPGADVVALAESLAETARAAGQARWAIVLYDEWIARSRSAEDRCRALLGLAWSYCLNGQPEAALTPLHDLHLANAPPLIAAEGALLQGRILRELKRPDAALAMFSRVIQIGPQSPHYAGALWEAALLHDELHQYNESAPLYETIVDTCANFAQRDAALYRWAWAAAETLGPDQAEGLFRRLLAEYPKSSYRPDAMYRLALLAFERGDYRHAAETIDQLLAEQPEGLLHRSAVCLEGQIALAQKDWPRAERAFASLLEEGADSHTALIAEFGAAEAAFQQDRHGEAFRRFEQLARKTANLRDPWVANVRLRLAQCLCREQRWGQAIELAQAVADDSSDAHVQHEAYYVVGRCLAAQGQFEQAREAFERVIDSLGRARTETAAKAQFMIAESYMHQEDYRAALREYLKLDVLYDYPRWQAAAVLQAAKCYEQIGMTEQAVREYRRVVEYYGETPFAAAAAERLEQMKQYARLE